ncbi:hypothetical protein FRC06_010204 [Ceratobasidium sp. 370]|nr:hypothetical protein FRC06_010204 [Ceratobasidium sp. 370]
MTNEISGKPTTEYAERRTARAQLQECLEEATEKQKYQRRLARAIEWSLNFLLILQVVIGALITVVNAVEQTRWTRYLSLGLGALGTVVGSLIARAKGTNQPELAESHAWELDKFIRACHRFIENLGGDVSEDVDRKVAELVGWYEAIEDKAIQADRGVYAGTVSVPAVDSFAGLVAGESSGSVRPSTESPTVQPGRPHHGARM